MAHLLHNSSVEAARVQQAKDAELLGRRKDGRRLRAGELRFLVRMLLVCHSREERRAVGLVLHVGMSSARVGKRLGITEHRVEELVEGVRVRVREAEELRHRERVLRRVGGAV